MENTYEIRGRTFTKAAEQGDADAQYSTLQRRTKGMRMRLKSWFGVLKSIMKDYQTMDYSPIYNNVSCHRPIDPMIIEKILYSEHP